MRLGIEDAVLEAVIAGTISGMEMTGVAPSPIGASRMITALHRYSILVGLVGESSGTVALSVSERVMRLLVGQMLELEVTALDDVTIDGIMEIGNMVAGCIKEKLQGTEFEVNRISLPSLIVGPAYNVVYARGITTVSVQFEVERFHDLSDLSDHVFSTSVSLLRASGG